MLLFTALKEDERALLKQFSDRLAEAMAPYLESDGAAFVRLSTRSPKDAALTSKLMEDLIEADIKKSELKGVGAFDALISFEWRLHRTVLSGQSAESEIEDLLIFNRACYASLRVLPNWLQHP